MFNVIRFLSFLDIFVASGDFCQLAISGSGTLYVHSRKKDGFTVSVVDKENGRVVRTLDTSIADEYSYCSIHAHENVLLLVEGTRTRHQYECVNVYENEVHQRRLYLLCECQYIMLSVLCGRDYLLQYTGISTLALIDLNQSESQAKFKTIQLAQTTYMSSLKWVASGDDQSGEGYLFTSHATNEVFTSQVYELNLKSVVDGTLLTPLLVPFMNRYGSTNVYFRCTMGTDAILCDDLCGKNHTEYKIKNYEYPGNILKLTKITD